MKKHIQNFNNFINENKKGKITYSDECLGYHNGQTDMETGIYEDGEIIGMVQYTLYQNELTIKDIIVLPKRRREGFGSMLMNYIKKQNPSYTYVPSMKTELGTKFIHKEINESIVNKILYHGSLWEFKKFKNKTAYFCDNPRFCYDYASTKSMDAGLDLDTIVYKCEFNGNLFSYKNEEDMNKLISLLPDKVKVHHGTAWFLDHDFNKEEMIKRLKGFATIEPIDYIKDANIGDEVPNPQYKPELFIVVDKDDNNIYTIDKRTYNDYLGAAINGYKEGIYSSGDLFKYKDIFDPWRQELFNTYNKNKGKNYDLIKHRYLIKEFIKTFQMSKSNYNVDYVSFDNNSISFTKEDIKRIDLIYNNCLEKFKETAYKELHRDEWNRKTIEEPIQSNWNYYENEVVANLIKKLGYDGYIALEKKHNTYAIYEPNKTIKILGKG